MSSERALATKVVKILKPLDAMRVENPCLPGTPDVNYNNGWIELKQADKWPKREETPLRVPHFSPQQKIWLQRRTEKGGICFVLIQVERDYILLAGQVAASILGEATQAELKKAAIFTVASKELPEALLNVCDNTNNS